MTHRTKGHVFLVNPTENYTPLVITKNICRLGIEKRPRALKYFFCDESTNDGYVTNLNSLVLDILHFPIKTRVGRTRTPKKSKFRTRTRTRTSKSSNIRHAFGLGHGFGRACPTNFDGDSHKRLVRVIRPRNIAIDRPLWLLCPVY